MNHKGTITIETERLIMRRFTPDDAAQMFENWAGDPEVTRFMRWKPYDNAGDVRRRLEEWEKAYEKEDYYHWGLQLKDGTLIGSLGIFVINAFDESAELGYCIGKAFWNKGYTTEASKAALDFVLKEVGFNRVEASHSVRNPASGKVMEKCGMAREGTVRQKYKSNEGFEDCALYGLTKDQYGL